MFITDGSPQLSYSFCKYSKADLGLIIICAYVAEKFNVGWSKHNFLDLNFLDNRIIETEHMERPR